MHAHTDDMPELAFAVILSDAKGATHLIEVNSGCACGMEDFVLRLPDLPFVPAKITVIELGLTRSLSYSR